MGGLDAAVPRDASDAKVGNTVDRNDRVNRVDGGGQSGCGSVDS